MFLSQFGKFVMSGWRGVRLPLAVYTLAALFTTWPLVTQLSTHIAGAGYGDGYEYLRLGWWARYALQNGLNPFQQSLFGYPDGFFSAFQWAQPLIYWPIALLNLVFDPVAAYNLWILIEVILSGLAAWWLCRVVLTTSRSATTHSGTAALLGGLIFMAYPAVQGHINAGHVNPLSNYAFPIMLGCLYRIVRGAGGWRTTFAGAVTFWLLALGNHTAVVFFILPLVLFGGGYMLLRQRASLLRRSVLLKVACVFGAGALLILPFYVPLAVEALAPDRPSYLQESGWVEFSTDPLAFVAPSPFTPWTGMLAPAYSRTVLGTNSVEGTAYLGIVAVGLAALAVLRRRDPTGLWLVILVGCMVFSLGPLLKWQDRPVAYTIGQHQSGVVLPWALFQGLPVINISRTPGRFNIMAGLMLGILAAFGLEALLGHVVRRGWRAALTGALVAFILAEYQLFFPFLTVPARLPAYFESLAHRTDVTAVFDVPWDDLIAQKVALYQQVAHHKPLIGGHVTRRSQVDPAKLALLSDAATGRAWDGALPTARLSAESARDFLRENGVSVVVYHLDLLDREATLRYAASAFGPPVFQDDQWAIFEVPSLGSNTDSSLPITMSGNGWWQAAGAGGPLWLSSEGEVYFYTPLPVDRQWTLTVAPFLASRRLLLAVDGQLDRAWQLDPTSPAPENITFVLHLEPGFHTLRFRLPDGCTQAPACLLDDPGVACSRAAAEKQVCAGLAVQRIETRAASEMAFQPLPITLASGVTLQGFRAPGQLTPGSRFAVETRWQMTSGLPAGDYHYFAHVLDPDGKLVAQYDGPSMTVPLLKTDRPQTWTEAATLTLPANLLPGRYRLFTGWYRYPEMTRLGVEGDRPGARDGLVYLQEVEVR